MGVHSHQSEDTMKATQELKNEHQGIALMLRIIEAVGGRLGCNGHVDAKHLSGIIEFLSIFVDKCHHGKEEEFLFPALEAVGVLRDGGPIGVLLDEHEQGRKLVAKLKEAVTSYTFGNKTAAATIQLNADQYVALLTQHIGKENTVLFPMADAKLDADKDTVLFEAFEQLERDRIGVGKHEEFHVLLDQLRDAYLS
jgi:hemerythrin-like domain-containing protein